ncbi:hypothetical protein GRI91_13590 [Altererythrobacter endophyticus]|uniref:TPM domain-containing protein n=1 Tax=Altericroceibacterium endophyticum TaxID=1808508 RepID=A0A6I4T9U9_9SPHN|nr:hypothetical protein [Altericroceibacterium endophyticum]
MDAANVLAPAQEQQLDQQLRAYNAQTGRAVIVATVPDLGGEPIDTYTRQLAENWGIGGAETEQGVLFLIAPKERELWITTARGVQTTLTDVMAGRIIRNDVVPRFKQGDMAGGIMAGVSGIIQVLNMDPADAAAIAEAEAAAKKKAGNADGGTIASAIFWIFMIGMFMLAFGRGGRGRRYRRRGGLGGAELPIMIWGASELGRHSGGHSGFGGGMGSGGGFGGGFGGFGGGGGGFNGGGAGGSW